jgi:hypothetical protein
MDDHHDPDALAHTVALDWWMGEKAKAREALDTCRMAVELPGAVRVNGEHLHLEGVPAAGFVVDEVRRQLGCAEALLESPEGYHDEWGELAPEVALEDAHALISRAWRVLLAAARNARTAREAVLIARALVHVVQLRRRIAVRAFRPPRARAAARWIARPQPLISLTQAAHGPPAYGRFPMSPQLAGGGPL